MGANESQTFSHHTFREEEWQTIPIVSYTRLKDPHYGSNFKVLCNKLNRTIEIEKYDLVFNSQSQYTTYKQLMDWRSTNRFLVSARHIKNGKESGLCSSFYQASVFFQRKPVRLYEIQDVPLQEGLYIIYAATQGFQKLYEKYGYFQIESEMISFTKEGLVKVWVNKNLSKSYPQNNVFGNKNKSYQIFISNLLALVQKLMDFENKVTITDFINRRRIKNPFDNLLSTLELYAKQIRAIVPRYLASIRNLCSKPKKAKNNKLVRDQRANLNSSYVLSNNSSISSNQRPQKMNPPNALYNLSINTPFKRSKELSYGQLTNRKKSSFDTTYRNSFDRGVPNVSFYYNGLGESPKNNSYTTQEELFMKSKIYSQLDSCQQKVRVASSVLSDHNLQIDPEIVADILKMVNNSL